MRTTKDGAIIVRARIHFAHLWKPREKTVKRKDKEGVEREVTIRQYEALLLFPKQPHPFSPDPEADIKGIQEEIKRAALKKFPDLSGLTLPFNDGDSTGKSGMETPRWPGYWHMNVKQNEDSPPVLRDGNLKEPNPSDWKWGDWADVKINLSVYQNAGKGVSAYVQGVQFLFVDEKLGGGGSNTDEGFEAQPGSYLGNAGAPGVDPDDPFSDE